MQQTTNTPTYGEAVENGEIVTKDGWHRPTGTAGIRDRRPACGCEPADGNKGAYRDVTVEMPDGRLVHFYHQSPIAVTFPDDSVRVSSCGWKTSTTKERLNRYVPRGYHIVQRDFDWYVKTPDGDRIDFRDGMILGN